MCIYMDIQETNKKDYQERDSIQSIDGEKDWKMGKHLLYYLSFELYEYSVC